MSNRFDSVDINCPKCNRSHKYALEIHRSIIMYHLPESAKTKEQPFTRIFICPDTNKKFQVSFVVVQQAGEVIHDAVPVNGPKEETPPTGDEGKTEKEDIRVEAISELTPHHEALYEAGKKLLTESITVGREFCKSMISINTGAIPIYLGILAFLLPDGYLLGLQRGIVIVIPALLYLSATIIFAFGYLPHTAEFSLDSVDEIEKERQRAISRMRRFIYAGFSCFIVATIMAITVILLNIGA